VHFKAADRIAEKHYQSRFSFNIWSGIIEIQLIEPFVLEDRVTSERCLSVLEDELPVLLEDVPLHIRREKWLQQDGTTSFW
jgi:hypothetical protein